MTMSQNVTSWFGNVSKQMTSLVQPAQKVWKKSESMQNAETEKVFDDNDNKEKDDVDAKIKMEQLPRKAVDTAKSLGNTLFSFAKDATETAINMKAVLISKTMMSDFDNEQRRFIDDMESRKLANVGAMTSVPPWVGCQEETLVKKQILALSLDSCNFLRDPPGGGTQFSFQFEHVHSVAMAILNEDANLSRMRFQLVPKCLSEERFWRNYFYRVSLIKQSTDHLDYLEPSNTSGTDSPNSDMLVDVEMPIVTEEEQIRIRHQLGITIDQQHSKIAATQSEDSQWEEEILADLNDYEFISQSTGKSEQDLEEEIGKLLETDAQLNQS